ncbi:hypothetical protein AT5A_25135 [Agrobacterium tumefaciens 5A]|nr:hypothetical protein AT5A_25135 [Agrobacterium tumefaciens 5A]
MARIAAPCEVRSSAGSRSYYCEKSNSFAINIAILRDRKSRYLFFQQPRQQAKESIGFNLPTVLEAVSLGTASDRKVLLIS